MARFGPPLAPIQGMRIAIVASLALSAALANAGTLLGIDNNGIYRIDTTTGVSTLAASMAGHGTGDTNGLAYNAATNTAYFQRNSKLWSVNLTSGLFTQTAYNIGDAASATFYNGAYYYGTGAQIKKVDFVAAAPSVVKTFAKSYGYGDIATDASGKVYGSSDGTIYRADLATAGNALTTLSTSGKQLQLGFLGSVLYGVATGNAGYGTGALYTVDTTTGVQSRVMNGGLGVTATYNGQALAIRDAASVQAVPEPGIWAALGLGAFGLLKRRKRA